MTDTLAEGRPCKRTCWNAQSREQKARRDDFGVNGRPHWRQAIEARTRLRLAQATEQNARSAVLALNVTPQTPHGRSGFAILGRPATAVPTHCREQKRASRESAANMTPQQTHVSENRLRLHRSEQYSRVRPPCATERIGITLPQRRHSRRDNGFAKLGRVERQHFGEQKRLRRPRPWACAETTPQTSQVIVAAFIPKPDPSGTTARKPVQKKDRMASGLGGGWP